MIIFTLFLLHSSAVFAADAVNDHLTTQFKSRVIQLLEESKELAIVDAVPPLSLLEHSSPTLPPILLQVLSSAKAKPKPPYKSITPECQRMENFWMNQCVTASPGSGLMKNNDPSKTKHGTRRLLR